ncbi:MAG: hypothetical protein EB141_03775, partial [Verrucomicrobia bacterium]|nr:hypothetical protein [Verrucomicrobiota bacterium]
MIRTTLLLAGCCMAFATPIFSADPPAKTDTKPKVPAKPAEPQRAPTQANVPYGTHERQVLDFYRAESATPTPVVFHIHGGGWVAGDKKGVAGMEKYLAAGISVVSINDLHRRVARYREMHVRLEAARKEATFAQTWGSLERVVIRTERALLQEVFEWHS